MRVVIALGGNALQRRGEPAGPEPQRRNLRLAAEAVAAVARRHEVVVTHGSGPQVGWLAMRTAGAGGMPAYPLDMLDAGAEGMIGYQLEQALANLLPGRALATLLTQVEVAADDPAFRHPDKPIGPLLREDEAQALARRLGWRLAAEAGGWRRVVASPRPLRIVELPAIRALLDAGTLIVCVGGGGIPVALGEEGGIHGVEAVIDKDRAAALLAHELRADALLLLTDVDAVYRGWGTPGATPIRRASPVELSCLEFAPGSMAPKVEAACAFVRGGGRLAGIGRLEDAAAVLAGKAGTRVTGNQQAAPTRSPPW
ncbi:MAG: carbamate kinase [Pseudomonadota bacterium]